MRQLFRMGLLLSVLLASGCGQVRHPVTVPATTQSPSAVTAKVEAVSDKDGWKALFDGKSLAGWEASDFAGAGKVHVKDGALLLERGKHMTGANYTRGDFPTMDYEVTLEGKKLDGNDFFCTTTFPVGKAHCSLVVGGWSGTVVGLSSLDSMDASMNDTRTDRDFDKDRWYRIRIRVSAKRIEAWIDQEKVVDQDTTDRWISIRVECNASLPFGIATYETTGAVRDIRVRPLTAADLKAIADSKPAAKE